jgi:uncharacterized protein YkwD
MLKILLVFCIALPVFSASMKEADSVLLKAKQAENKTEKDRLFEQAGAMYLKLLNDKSVPRHEVLERIGEFYYFKHQQATDTAKKDQFLKMAVKALKISVQKKEDYALAYAKLGEIHAQAMGDFDMSRYYYEKATRYESDNYLYRLGLAFSYSQRNYFKEALQIYEKTIRDFPKEDVRLYLNKADVLRRAGGYQNEKNAEKFYSEAVDTLDRIFKVKPSYYADYLKYIYHDKGLNYILLQQYDKAVDFLEKTLAQDSKYALAHYHLGVAYYRQYSANKPKNDKQPVPKNELKYLEKAVNQMQIALKLDPGLDQAKESLYILSPSYKQELEKWKEETLKEVKETAKKEEQKEPEKPSIYSKAVLNKLISAMVQRINQDRAKFGLQPVKEDDAATKIGMINAIEQQKYQFVGHQSVDGSDPYYRYSQIGGNDYHAQNTAGRWGYRLNSLTYEQVLDWIMDSHYRMVSEVPPHDGHRRNILDPYRNFVGIGIAYSNKNCYLTQEFLNRYIAFKNPIPKKVRKGREFSIQGKPYRGYKVAGATIFYEPFFSPLTPAQINDIPNYGLPDTRLDLYKKLPAGYKYSNGSNGDIELKSDGSFSLPLKQYKGSGVYTLVIWLSDESKGKVFPASTISVKVD